MALLETLIMSVANAAPRGVQRIIRGAAATDSLLGWTAAVTRHTLRAVRRVDRIAVVSDTHIGDAVLLQEACSVFKQWLPGCAVDYFYQKEAHALIQANPVIDVHRPVFSDADFTSVSNRLAVLGAIRERRYDFILNLYPFLTNSELAEAGCPVLVPYRLITGIVRAEQDPAATAHVAYHLHQYVENICRILTHQQEARSAKNGRVETSLHLAADVPARADHILRAAGVPDGASLALLNPDSSSRFSCIPIELQAAILERLLDLDRYDRVLLGPAYSFAEMPGLLCARIAGHPGARKLMRLPPEIPIDVFTGLIDRADMFISADTAQMHIAAARRLGPGPNAVFRNRTAIASIFGATHSRVYGYDSCAPGHMDSSQEAPARVFQGAPACRNLTCIHKTRKNCRTVRCFDGFDTSALFDWLNRWTWPPVPTPETANAAADNGERA